MTKTLEQRVKETEELFLEYCKIVDKCKEKNIKCKLLDKNGFKKFKIIKKENGWVVDGLKRQLGIE